MVFVCFDSFVIYPVDRGEDQRLPEDQNHGALRTHFRDTSMVRWETFVFRGLRYIKTMLAYKCNYRA